MKNGNWRIVAQASIYRSQEERDRAWQGLHRVLKLLYGDKLTITKYQSIEEPQEGKPIVNVYDVIFKVEQPAPFPQQSVEEIMEIISNFDSAYHEELEELEELGDFEGLDQFERACY